MRVLHDTPLELTLGGIPGGASSVWLPLLVGSGISVVAAAFCLRAINAGEWYGAVMTGFGTMLGLLFLGVGIDHIFLRERLTLDRVTGEGSYRKNSSIRGQLQSYRFPLASVVRVSIEHTEEASSGGKRSGLPTEVVRARLLIDKPRRACVLDEVRNGSPKRLEALAARVAEFLNVPVRTVGNPADE
ncbi:MAG: hypothetical protein IPM64_15420 [Phycisphaerales bacterium]|nr:hypothetical protein [Phycisphaerales bacterium]